MAVLAAAGVTAPELGEWPVLLAALAAQVVTDNGVATLREWAGLGISPKLQPSLFGWVTLVDVLLSPVGLLAAMAAVAEPYAVLLVLPLAGLLFVFALERGARVRQAIELSRAYRGTTLLLSDVLEADDEYTGVPQPRRRVALDRGGRRDGPRLEPSAATSSSARCCTTSARSPCPRRSSTSPGPLTEDEWIVIKTHTIEGQRMLDRVGGLLSEVGRIVRSSHEKWDGTGYPDGLVGDADPGGLRDRLLLRRLQRHDHRPLLPRRDVARRGIEELQANSGTQFSPAVVEAAAARAQRGPAHRRCPRPAGRGSRLMAKRRESALNSTICPSCPAPAGKASTSERAKKPAAKRAAAAAAQGGHPHAEPSSTKPARAATKSRTRGAQGRSRLRTAAAATAGQDQGEGARARLPAPPGRPARRSTRRRAPRPSSPTTSASCSATSSRSSRSTPTRPPRRSTATLVERAFLFSCERHADQRRASGEDFIVHPVGVAKICAGMRLDTATLCAALLHDTVEDTSASLDEVREEFGDEIAQLVDGVTKLSGVTFQSRDDRQAENYRKMMVAMARDIRVILIKLADRLHNMRTIGSMPKHKQQEKARETLEIFAPLAHRLGIHAIKWELEDLAFTTLHPRKYNEIRQLVSQQREERDAYVDRAGEYLRKELKAVGIEAEISGRAKHFYSIYSKMTKKGREFNEIYDLTAMRVIVDSVKDCYGAIGVIHSLWKPLPGRFKDWVAMPKFNMYQALHTTVIGPEGRPLEIQIRTMEMHRTAEFGVAAHWIYKEDGGKPVEEKVEWLRHLLDWQQEMADPQEFAETLKADLFEDEVFVFTPKGEVKSLGAGATPLDFAYEIHTDVGHRCVGAKVNGKIVPLHYSSSRATSARCSPRRRSAGRRATGSRWPRPRAPSRRSAPGSSASAARTRSAPAARSSRRTSSAPGCRRRRWRARRCSPT